MGYVISGTEVDSVDYTDFPFGGNGSNGNALSLAPSGWISYTFTRPTVRESPDGKERMIVKNVSFRCCAAPTDSEGKSGTSYKMYGRVSYADGSAYANSYQPPNPISWQKAPTHTYSFQGTKFAMQEGIDGTTVRVWLVSGGPLLFQRNTGGPGHVVGSTGQTWGGSPAGYLTVAQIASPPKNLKVVRTTANPQQVTVTWEKPDHLGGTMSGYHLEVAEDAAFTQGVREYYPSLKSGAALVFTSTGYSQKKPYWFRIAARNEVSEYFDEKGGQWSNVATIAIDTTTAANPPTDAGIPGGSASDGASPGGADGSGGSTKDPGAAGTVVTGGQTGSTTGGSPDSPGDTSPDSPTTGTSGSTGSSGSSSSGTVASTTDLQKVLARIPEVKADVILLQQDLAKAMAAPSFDGFRTARSDTNLLKSDISYIAQRSLNSAWITGWSVAATLIVSAYQALTTASNAANDTDQTGDAAKYQTASDAVTALISAVNSAISATPAAPPAGGGGTTPPTGGDGSTPAPPVIYTPIPDTSPNRSRKGGLLRSRQPKSTKTTVFVYDRGGKRRIGQLYGLSQIAWGRVRDDMSDATITMSREAALRNSAVLQRLGVARSEIVIYRGDQRVWEGPITRLSPKRSGVELYAQDVSWYLSRAAVRHAYSNAYPNVGYTVDRIAGIIDVEMQPLETPVIRGGVVVVPPINVLPYLHTYVEDGDTRTSSVTDAYASDVWTMLDDLAAHGGIDYTVIGRSIHIWDTSRAALGRTRTVTEQDFIGDPYVSYYGSEVAAIYTITDGQGNYASLFNQQEIDDPYYGALEKIGTAYGATSTTTTTDGDGNVTTTTTAETVAFDAMADQARRGAVGRDPAPAALHIPDNSSIDTSRSGLGIDVMIPGVYVPVLGEFSGFEFATVQKIASLRVTVASTREGMVETVNVTMEPTSSDDNASDEDD